MRFFPAPHTKDWWYLLNLRNPERASIVWERARGPAGLEVCTLCGATARTENYTVVQGRDYPVPTLKLCNECHDEYDYRGLVRGPHPLPPEPPSPPWVKRSKVALRGIAVRPPKNKAAESEGGDDGARNGGENAAEGKSKERKLRIPFNEYRCWCTTCERWVQPMHGRRYPKRGPDGQVVRKAGGKPEWECDCKPRHALGAGDQRSMLVLRTAGRRDFGQNLLLGNAIRRIPGETEYEVVFYGPEITKSEFARLQKYTTTHGIKLYTLDEFLKLFHDAVWEAEALFCGWDLAFDVSRLAWKFGGRAPSTKRFHNGFTIYLYKYPDHVTGGTRPDSKSLSILAKRNEAATWIEFTRPKGSNKPKGFRGNAVTLSDLAAALSGDRRTAREACLLFGAPVGPDEFEVPLIDEVTPEAIDGIRQENRTLVGLADKLIEEFNRHSFNIPVTELKTAARIPKEYMREAGIIPPAKRQVLDLERCGSFASTGHGGDAVVTIRDMYCPVRSYDFTKAYATSFTLLGLDRFLYAEKINFVDGCVEEVNRIIQRTAADSGIWFNLANWEHLTYIVELVPDGSLSLPVRVQAIDGTWYSTIAPVRSAKGESLWFTLADVLRAIIRRTSNRLPKILNAIKIVPEGTLSTLHPIKIRGQVEIDPRRGDGFFKTLVEMGQRIKQQSVEPGTPGAFEARRLSDSCKITGNIGAFGIFSQTVPDDTTDEEQLVHVYSKDGMMPAKVIHPELPGEYYYAPFAVLVPAAVRFLMGLFEKAVSDEGGSVVFTCIDCAAVVATPKGGYDDLPQNVVEDLGREKILPLSYDTAEAIASRFDSLNVYDKATVRTLLAPKLHVPGRQLYCRAVDVNLHAFFEYRSDGRFHLLDDNEAFSEHTLGCYENPKGKDTDPIEWIRDVWEGSTKGLERIPAVQKYQVSSRNLMDRILDYNEGKPFPETIKPFNIYVKCSPRRGFSYEEVPGLMIAPYDPDPDSWARMSYLCIPPVSRENKLSAVKCEGESRVEPKDTPSKEKRRPPYMTPISVRYNPPSQEVQSYAEIVRKCMERPEYRCCDLDGNECTSEKRGVIYPTPIEITDVLPMGREHNERDLINLGMAKADQLYTYYKEVWNPNLQNKVKSYSTTELSKATGKDPSQIRKWKSNKKVPGPEACELLKRGMKEIDSNKVSDARGDTIPDPERLREEVKAMNWSIRRLALLAGMSKDSAGRFMRGDRVASETLCKIEAALSRAKPQGPGELAAAAD